MGSFTYKYGGLLALTLQQAAMPLLVRYTRYRSPEKVFITTVNVFMMDLMKLVVCSMILLRTTQSPIKFLKDLHEAIWVRRVETLKVCIPALIYVLQNNLFYIAGSHLEATTVYICYQMKLFTTAFLMRLILGKMLSGKQWIALCILVAGVIDVQLVYSPPTSQGKLIEQEPLIGFGAVFTMCFTSALAGVYLEKVLKGSDESVWMQNIRLALVGLPLSAARWDFWVLVLTIFNSVGGLLIAVVMKYADNILKAYAQSMAIIGAAIGSWMLFDFVPNVQFILGAGMVMSSIVLYSLYPYKPSQKMVVELQKIAMPPITSPVTKMTTYK